MEETSRLHCRVYTVDSTVESTHCLSSVIFGKMKCLIETQSLSISEMGNKTSTFVEPRITVGNFGIPDSHTNLDIKYAKLHSYLCH